MEGDEEFLVPQNSFADERDFTNTPKSRKTTLNSLATSTTYNYPKEGSESRLLESARTPAQSFKSRTNDTLLQERSITQLSGTSLTANRSNISQKVSSNQIPYDMSMLRSGHSAMHELKSRLYNRPVDSEVFKTLNNNGSANTNLKSKVNSSPQCVYIMFDRHHIDDKIQSLLQLKLD